MAKEITFPYQIEFKYSVYDCNGECKIEGKKLRAVVLKDGNRLSPDKAKRQLECGVELNSSRKKIGDSEYKYTTTVTIINKDALPVKMLGFTEYSYSCPGRPREIFGGTSFALRVFVDDHGKVIQDPC